MNGGTHRPSHIVVSSSHIVASSRVILVAPQLWCSCPTIVVQLPHSCGAIAPQLWGNGNDGETNSFLTFGNGETGWKFGIRNWSNVKVPHLALQGVSKEFVLRGKAMYRTLLATCGSANNRCLYLIYNRSILLGVILQ